MRSFRPHIITRRYAEFCAAIGGLNEYYPETRIENILDELSAEVELCVSRMASIFPHPQSKLIFLINNYDMLLGKGSVFRTLNHFNQYMFYCMGLNQKRRFVIK